MAWLERHEPWVDWRSKTLGATRTAPSEALESHEPTSARKQKRYWREPRPDMVSVLDIGMSELHDSNVVDVSLEQSSSTVCETARTSLSDIHSENESLNAKSIVGLEPRHPGLNPDDVCEVARNPLGDLFELSNSSPDVGTDISSRIEQIKGAGIYSWELECSDLYEL